MDNKEMRKEFEIWAKENYLKLGIDKEEVPIMFNLYKDGSYDYCIVDKVFKAFLCLYEVFGVNMLDNLKNTTALIWTWEEYKSKVLPQVGAIVEDNNRVKAEILFNKYGFVGFLCETDGGNPSSLSEAAFLSHFKPLETPQQKYNRERSEFVKSIEVPAYVWKDSVSDFKAGLSVAYEKLKPFKEEQK